MSEVIENPALYLPTPAPVLETLQKSSKGTTSRLTAKAATRQFLIDKVNKSGKSESINERVSIYFNICYNIKIYLYLLKFL